MARTSAECGACAARIEVLEIELRQLRASVDQMHRCIGLVLVEIGSAMAGELPALCAATHASTLQSAVQGDDSSATKRPPGTNAELDWPSTVQPIVNGGVAAAKPLADGLPALPASCAMSAHRAAASADITPPAPSSARPRIDNGHTDVPWDAPAAVVLDETERRALRRASWAAGVALIAAFGIIAANGGWARRPAQLELSTRSDPTFTRSDQEPASSMHEIWRLRAKSAF
jgi:hypothetical protein